MIQDEIFAEGARSLGLHPFTNPYGDVFDHSDLDFIGGAWLDNGGGENDPLSGLGSIDTVEGRQWGQAYKEAMPAAYQSIISISVRGENMAYEDHFLDLDPTYTDAWGQPLLRMTYEWAENDRRMYSYLAERATEIMTAMRPDQMVAVTQELEPWDLDQGDNHPAGGTTMGTDPATSVTNKYGQLWEVPNVFAVGASMFPQNPSFNPTETICALAYHTTDAVRRHLNAPDELMT